jgi:hypothetical protein
MVALGWMNILWMGLFAGIIFGEKIWSRGIWVARAAGIGLIVIGGLVAAGMLPSIVSSATSMTGSEEEGKGDNMETMIPDNNANSNDNNNDNDMARMRDSIPKASMDMSDDSMASMKTNDVSDEIR